MARKVKDPVSGYMHVFGTALSAVGLVLLLMKSYAYGASVWHYVAFSIFGAGMILLYSASSTYHLLNLQPKTMLILRKIDHIMIFVLIAATYTPICLIPLRGPWGWSMFAVVWGFSALGMVFKAVWFDAPRWLYTLCYILLGWSSVICIYPLIKSVPVAGLLWLLAGGIAYSVGAVCYATKWPGKEAKYFGFHELFHVLIIVGTFCHFMMMYLYLTPMK